MSKAPIINQKQQKQTLKAKKKTTKGFKLTLAQPYPVFWPELADDDKSEIKQFLQNIKKEELQFGLSTLLRNLKSDKHPYLLLISLSVQPHFVIQQIIHLSVSKGINILIVPNLDKMCGKLFGFSTLAVTLPTKRDAELDEWIRARMTSFRTVTPVKSNRVIYHPTIVKQIRKNPNKQ